MSGWEAKFCLDRNQVRWVLLEGVINRKTPQDDPDKGMNLAIEKIQSIENTQVERRHENPLARPAMVAGFLILALFGWLSTITLWAGVPGLIIGAIVLGWGLLRLGGTTERLDAFQIVAPGTNPKDWYIVGSHLEVLGFIEGLRKEIQQIQNRQAALKN
ncbi:MAG: hypothetical protein HYX73_05700 [Acidobacteria bacterium]|nr:hypothetical protein [Acidobacteriota bacterium]